VVKPPSIEATAPAGTNTNANEEPPEFDESEQIRLTKNRDHIDAEKIEVTIRMLKQHLNPEDISPLVAALEALKEDPNSGTNLEQVLHAFNELGPYQGAVLTYAPYVSILLYDDPFGNF